jgi:hypothetical protein
MGGMAAVHPAPMQHSAGSKSGRGTPSSDPDIVIDLKVIVQHARSVQALRSSAVLLVSLLFLFISAAVIRPNLARVKDTLNRVFE